MGIISQKILQDINARIREKTGLKQWRSTTEAVNWFKGLEGKQDLEFMICDIVDFYPSISETLLKKAIRFASKTVTVRDSDIEILLHSRSTILFNKGEAWQKKESLFDVSMGAYDGAEVAELVGLYLLDQINETIPSLNFGLYRDDGLAAYKSMRARIIEQQRKKLIKLFKDNGLDITLQFRLHQVNYLDASFDLASDSIKPYRKPNDIPVYINRQSNHPPAIKKQLTSMVGKRLSSLSSNELAFNEAAPEYNAALKKSGYRDSIKYDIERTNVESTPRRKRKKRVVWYNPPYNDAVTTNIGKKFLQLLDRCFKPRNKLYKIINRHLVKISYSCMPNMKSIIDSHNKKLLSNSGTPPDKLCNCQRKTECPLRGECLQEAVIYQATVTTPTEVKTYIGSTEKSFKKRFYSHKSDMTHEKNRANTSLATYFWEQKDRGITPTIEWKVIRKCRKYMCGGKRCDVCLSEKLAILKNSDPNLINKKSELMGKCPHKRKWKLCLAETT